MSQNRLLILLAIAALLTMVALTGCTTTVVQAVGQEEEGQTYNFDAEAVTGLNRRFGQPLFIFDFAPEPFDKTGFTTIGVFNPDGAEPLPLTAETPDEAILATFVDPFVDELVPQPVAATVDPRWVNVPIRDIETWTTPDLMTRAALPSQLAGPVVGLSQAEPSGPITKGDWLKASGKMTIQCTPQGNSVTIRVRNQVPNRVYTVWMIWIDPAAPRFIPLPLGGAPNAYITDEWGNAVFKRDLNFCPVEAAEEGVEGIRLAFFDAHLHSDHILYGGVPLPLFAGFPPGTVLQPHLTWNLGAGIPQEVED